MKRKLIKFDAFEKLQSESLSNSELELTESAPILARALGLESLQLSCYGGENALYECNDGTYVHVNYVIKEGAVAFENIEQLVIDETSEGEKSRGVLRKMLESVLEGNDKQADVCFEEYLNLPSVKRVFFEEKKLRSAPIRKNGKIVGYKKVRWQTTPRHRESPAVTARRMRAKKINFRKRSPSQKNLLRLKRQRITRQIGEWANLCETVNDYLGILEHGNVIKESVARHDNEGNVVFLKLPTYHARNEAKILTFNWKTLNTDVKVLRGNAKKLNEDTDFIKKIADFKRQNGFSDNNAMEEACEEIVSRWPEVIYLTQSELAKSIKSCLETAGAVHFDDQTCEFMAEGILRLAHNTYTDKVNRVVRLSGNKTPEGDDAYLGFAEMVDVFYPTLDETHKLEMQVFVDLYSAIREVYEAAQADDNTLVATEAANHLNELASIIRGHVEPEVTVVESAVDWLTELVETNLETSDWNPSGSVHTTLNGDHPKMAELAKKGYSPAADGSGDWGDPAPVSDGKSYKGGLADEMRGNSWGNIGGEDAYPSLSNPYVPKAGEFKIKGEKDIDSDSDQLATDQGDTWPTLQNPYVPKSVVPQLNKGKEADAVANL